MPQIGVGIFRFYAEISRQSGCEIRRYSFANVQLAWSTLKIGYLSGRIDPEADPPSLLATDYLSFLALCLRIWENGATEYVAWNVEHVDMVFVYIDTDAVRVS